MVKKFNENPKYGRKKSNSEVWNDVVQMMIDKERKDLKLDKDNERLEKAKFLTKIKNKKKSRNEAQPMPVAKSINDLVKSKQN